MVIGLRPRAVVVGRSRGLALGIGECSVAGRVVWGGRTEQQRVAVPARSYTPLLLRAGLARVEGEEAGGRARDGDRTEVDGGGLKQWCQCRLGQPQGLRGDENGAQ